MRCGRTTHLGKQPVAASCDHSERLCLDRRLGGGLDPCSTSKLDVQCIFAAPALMSQPWSSSFLFLSVFCSSLFSYFFDTLSRLLCASLSHIGATSSRCRIAVSLAEQFSVLHRTFTSIFCGESACTETKITGDRGYWPGLALVCSKCSTRCLNIRTIFPCKVAVNR